MAEGATVRSARRTAVEILAQRTRHRLASPSSAPGPSPAAVGESSGSIALLCSGEAFNRGDQRVGRGPADYRFYSVAGWISNSATSNYFSETNYGGLSDYRKTQSRTCKYRWLFCESTAVAGRVRATANTPAVSGSDP